MVLESFRHLFSGRHDAGATQDPRLRRLVQQSAIAPNDRRRAVCGVRSRVLRSTQHLGWGCSDSVGRVSMKPGADHSIRRRSYLTATSNERQEKAKLPSPSKTRKRRSSSPRSAMSTISMSPKRTTDHVGQSTFNSRTPWNTSSIVLASVVELSRITRVSRSSFATPGPSICSTRNSCKMGYEPGFCPWNRAIGSASITARIPLGCGYRFPCQLHSLARIQMGGSARGESLAPHSRHSDPYAR